MICRCRRSFLASLYDTTAHTAKIAQSRKPTPKKRHVKQATTCNTIASIALNILPLNRKERPGQRIANRIIYLILWITSFGRYFLFKFFFLSLDQFLKKLNSFFNREIVEGINMMCPNRRRINPTIFVKVVCIIKDGFLIKLL